MSNENDTNQNDLAFEVEKILKHRVRRKKNKKNDPYCNDKFEYLIKWVGYEKPSWEPESCLDNCQELLCEYKAHAFKKNKKNKKINTFYIYEDNDVKKKNIVGSNNITPNKKIDIEEKYSKSCIKVSSKKKKETNYFPKDDTFAKEYRKQLNKRSKSPKAKIKTENFIHEVNTNKGSSKNNINIDKSEKINNKYNHLSENNDNNKTPYSDHQNIFNKVSLNSEFDCCPCFYDIMRGNKSVNSKNMEEETVEKKLCSKKRKRTDSLSSSPYSILIEELENEDSIHPKKMSNTNTDSNSNNNNDKKEKNNRIDFIDIEKIRVPSNQNEKIKILCRFKINGKIIDINGTRNLNLFPKEEICKYYEQIIKNYHSGKSFIFQ